MSNSDNISKISNGVLRTSLQAIKEVAILTRDVGMPITLFATGIVKIISVNKDAIWVAPGLIILGLFTQLWIYIRENPKKKGDELIDHLEVVTQMARELSKKNTYINNVSHLSEVDEITGIMNVELRFYLMERLSTIANLIEAQHIPANEIIGEFEKLEHPEKLRATMVAEGIITSTGALTIHGIAHIHNLISDKR